MATQAEVPESTGLAQHSKVDFIEARIMRSELAAHEQHLLVRYLNFCWLEYHRDELIAHLRRKEPDFEKTERKRLTDHYNRPTQRLKLFLNNIPAEAVKISVDRQTRQALEAKRQKTTLLGYTLDPQSPRYYRRHENEVDGQLKSQTAREILTLIRAYDWKQPSTTATPNGHPSP